MAHTDITICSTALVLLGSKPITSFSNSDRGITANAIYPTVKERVLRSHPWNCAVTRVKLTTPDVTPPVYEYGKRFALPADCLRLLNVGQKGETFEYEVEGNFIVTDEASVSIRYIKNIAESLFDSSLAQVMIYAMKAELAYPITESTTERDNCRAEYMAMLRDAKNLDAQENPPEDFGDNPILEARYS